jgi:hypothetical protein
MAGFSEVEIPELPSDPNEGDLSILGNGSFGTLIISGITTVGLGTTSLPTNSQLTFELTSDTNLRLKVRGTDGILRSANITLS